MRAGRLDVRSKSRPEVTLRPVFVEVMPSLDAIKPGKIWISHRHRTVNLRCPCGCGDLTVLSLHPSRWHVHFDGKSVSLAGPTGGSVWANSGCGSHYLVRHNAVIWLDRIDPIHHAGYATRERARLMHGETGGMTFWGRVRRALLQIRKGLSHFRK